MLTSKHKSGAKICKSNVELDTHFICGRQRLRVRKFFAQFPKGSSMHCSTHLGPEPA